MTKKNKENKGMGKVPNTSRNVPNLRFAQFKAEKWNSEKIGMILSIGSGRDYKHLQTGSIPVYGTGGYMTSVDDYLYEGESVCIGRKGTIDKPFYFNEKFWTVDTLFYTHSFKKVTPKFVFYIFEKINWLKYNEASGVPSLSKSTIEQIEINIPSILEQQKIASFLSLIDESIQTQNKTLLHFASLMQIIKKDLLLQNRRFKNYEGNDFSEWEEMRLEDICEKQSSNISANKIEDHFGDFPIYGATGVLKKIDFYEMESEYIGIIKDGAGVGRLFLCQSKSSVLGTLDIIKSKSVNLYFLYYLLSNIDFGKYITGSTIPHIYFRDYKNEYCQIPSLAEQKKIAAFLSAIDQRIQVEKEILALLEKQKKYLLQQMFV